MLLIFSLVSLRNDIHAKSFYQPSIHNTKQDSHFHHKLLRSHNSADRYSLFDKVPEADLLLGQCRVLSGCQLLSTILFGHASHEATSRFFFVYCSQIFGSKRRTHDTWDEAVLKSDCQNHLGGSNICFFLELFTFL